MFTGGVIWMLTHGHMSSNYAKWEGSCVEGTCCCVFVKGGPRDPLGREPLNNDTQLESFIRRFERSSLQASCQVMGAGGGEGGGGGAQNTLLLSP